MGKTLFQKIWDAHSVGILPDGRTQMFIATHLLHEVTSPQAFGMVRDLGLTVRHPERTFATVDHIIPTDNQAEPFADATADAMIKELRRNCAENDIRFFDLPTGLQGIVHMVGPELGITQPGMTIVCGDSHTATHGAFGSIAMGIGTTQVRDVLATQTMALSPLKVRRINVNGKLAPGVRAKDVALHIIGLLGAKGGLGFAYEYGGNVIDAMSMDERMTLCNMSIEGAARCGYVNPDQTTVEYIKGRLFAPTGADWDKAVERWLSFASDADAEYDEIVEIDGAAIEPTLTWGISPDQNTGISGSTPNPSSARNDDERKMIDLVAPADVPLFTVLAVSFRLLLVFLNLVQLGAQHVHGLLLVAKLAAFVLAGYDHSGGNVRDAHGGFHLVHILAALAAGTVGVHLQILVQNLNTDGIGNLRRSVQGGKGSMPLTGGIKGRNAHQAVDAAFILQITVSILSIHLQGHGTDAGVIPVRAFQISHGKAAALTPADVHAHQHGRPVTGFRAACPGVNGHITGSLVLRAVQQGQQLKIRQGLLPFGKLLHGLPAQVVVIRLLGQFNGSVNILQTGFQCGKRLHPVFQGIHFRHQRPRGILVIPEIRSAHAFVQLGHSLLNAVQVKDSSRARKDGCAKQPCRAPRDRSSWNSSAA